MHTDCFYLGLFSSVFLFVSKQSSSAVFFYYHVNMKTIDSVLGFSGSDSLLFQGQILSSFRMKIIYYSY